MIALIWELNALFFLQVAWLTLGSFTCKKCEGRGSGWWAVFHRCRDEWRRKHPGVSEHWR